MKTCSMALGIVLLLLGSAFAQKDAAKPREFSTLVAHWAEYADPDYLPFLTDAKPDVAQVGESHDDEALFGAIAVFKLKQTLTQRSRPISVAGQHEHLADIQRRRKLLSETGDDFLSRAIHPAGRSGEGARTGLTVMQFRHEVEPRPAILAAFGLQPQEAANVREFQWFPCV